MNWKHFGVFLANDWKFPLIRSKEILHFNLFLLANAKSLFALFLFRLFFKVPSNGFFPSLSYFWTALVETISVFVEIFAQRMNRNLFFFFVFFSFLNFQAQTWAIVRLKFQIGMDEFTYCEQNAVSPVAHDMRIEVFVHEIIEKQFN